MRKGEGERGRGEWGSIVRKGENERRKYRKEDRRKRKGETDLTTTLLIVTILLTFRELILTVKMKLPELKESSIKMKLYLIFKN